MCFTSRCFKILIKMKINTILRWLVWLGVFLLPFTPLLLSTSLFFPYITGKAFFFRIIVEIIFGAWIFLALLDPNYRLKRSALVWAFGFLALVLVASTLLGADPYHSFWSNFERMEGLITYLHLLAYLVVLATVLRSRRWWGALLGVSLGVSLVVGFWAISQWSASTVSGFRADASLGNPIYLGVYGLLHFFLALFWWLRAKSWWPRLGLGLLALFQLVTIYVSGTRSAIVGLVVGLLVALVLVAWREKHHPRIRFWATILLLVVVLAGGAFWLARDNAVLRSNPVLARLANISLADGTTRDRLLVWNIGWQGFKERPILGWGLENFNLVFNKYFDPSLYGAEPWFDRSHNILIDWLVHAGVFGLAAYLSLFVVAFYLIWRRTAWSNLERSCLSGLLAAYLVNNLFVFDNLTSFLIFFGVLAFLYQETGGGLEIKTVARGWEAPLAAWLALPIVVGLGFGLYFFNLKPWGVAQDLVGALSLEAPASLPAAQANQYLETQLALFRNILARQTFGNGETSEQLATIAFRLLSRPELDLKLKQDLANLAIQSLGAQVAASPLDARHELFLGNFLAALGSPDGIKHLERAHELSPNKQQIIFQLSLAYYQAGEKNKALTLARTAYELDPQISDAQKFYEAMKKKI